MVLEAKIEECAKEGGWRKKEGWRRVEKRLAGLLRTEAEVCREETVILEEGDSCKESQKG